jgi:tetratricopeptide (TPR) repeat protein
MAESHREEIAKLEALYASNPGGRVFVHLAEAYRRTGEHERARRILDEGLSRHIDSVSGFVVLGRVLTDLGEVTEAASAFQRVLELDDGNLVALRGLGDLARQAHRLDEAARYYDEALTRNPSDSEVRGLLGSVQREQAEAPTEAAAPFAADSVYAADPPFARDSGLEQGADTPAAPIAPPSVAPGQVDEPSDSMAEEEFGLVEIESLPGDLAALAGLAGADMQEGAEDGPDLASDMESIEWSVTDADDDFELVVELDAVSEAVTDVGANELTASPLDVSPLDAVPAPDLSLDVPPEEEEPPADISVDLGPGALAEGIEYGEEPALRDEEIAILEEFQTDADEDGTPAGAIAEEDHVVMADEAADRPGLDAATVRMDVAGDTAFAADAAGDDAASAPGTIDDVVSEDDAVGIEPAHLEQGGFDERGFEEDADAEVGIEALAERGSEEDADVAEIGIELAERGFEEDADVAEIGIELAERGFEEDADVAEASSEALVERVFGEGGAFTEAGIEALDERGFEEGGAFTEAGIEAQGERGFEEDPDVAEVGSEALVERVFGEGGAFTEAGIEEIGIEEIGVEDSAVEAGIETGAPIEEGRVETVAFGGTTIESGEESGAADTVELETETIAELYRSQGFHERAAGIYQSLLRRRPDDERLLDRLREVERAMAPVTRGQEKTETDRVEPEGTEPDESWLRGAGVAWTGEDPSPPETTPYAWTDDGDDEAGGPLVREYLQQLIGWASVQPPRPEGAPDMAPAEPAQPGESAMSAQAGRDRAGWEHMRAQAGPEPAAGADPADAAQAGTVEPDEEAGPEFPWDGEPATDVAAAEPLDEPDAAADTADDGHIEPDQTWGAPAGVEARSSVADTPRTGDPVEDAFLDWYSDGEPPAEAEEAGVPGEPASGELVLEESSTPLFNEGEGDDEDLEMFRTWLKSLKK